MPTNSSAYRQSLREIVKTSSIYGGVQVVQLIGSLVKTKAIAAWLGPQGIAINGLLNQLLQVLSQCLHFGFETVIVRRVAEGLGLSSQTVQRLRQWGSYTGVISGLVAAVFSGPLSQLTFGDSRFWPLVLLLGLSLVFKQLLAVEVTFLQGLRKYKRLARVQIVASIIALVCSLPLYYYWHEKGIVLGLLIGLLLPYVMLRFQRTTTVTATNPQPVELRPMLAEGARIALTGIYTAVALYGIQIGIQSLGGIEQVGYYQAAFGLLLSYSGLLLAAMSTDYLPRLSRVSTDHAAMQLQVNQQALIGLLTHIIVGCLLILAAPEIIYFLFARDFYPAIMALQLGAIGVFWRSASLSLGYVFLAKGESRYYLRLGLFTNTLLLVLVLGGYWFAGLAGAGLGFSLYYALHFCLMQFINRRMYQLALEGPALRLLISGSLVLFVVLAIGLQWEDFAGFGLRAAFAIVLSIVYLRQFRQQLR